ncbi:IS110 family transposase [Bradyrhizobium sp. RDM12]
MIEDAHWFAGIDWATQSHSVCLLDAEGRQVARREFAHDGAGLTELRDWLLEKTKAAPGQIAVAIEMPHGPVVEMLLEHGFAVFAINPKQLDRFRDRFTAAGAKDDRRDAHVLAGSLRTDRAAFRRLVVDDPTMIELREWSRLADELQQERTRLANRLRQQLWRYYPQATKLTDDVADEWFLALWQKVPTPDRAAKASEKAIARILSIVSAVSMRRRRSRSCVRPRCSWRRARPRPPAPTSAAWRRACIWSIGRSRRLIRAWTVSVPSSKQRRAPRGRARRSAT